MPAPRGPAVHVHLAQARAARVIGNQPAASQGIEAIALQWRM